MIRGAVGKKHFYHVEGRMFEAQFYSFRIPSRRNCEIGGSRLTKGSFFFCFLVKEFVVRKLDGIIAQIRCQTRGVISNMSINFCDIPEHSLGNGKIR